MNSIEDLIDKFNRKLIDKIGTFKRQIYQLNIHQLHKSNLQIIDLQLIEGIYWFIKLWFGDRIINIRGARSQASLDGFHKRDLANELYLAINVIEREKRGHESPPIDGWAIIYY